MLVYSSSIVLTLEVLQQETMMLDEATHVRAYYI